MRLWRNGSALVFGTRGCEFEPRKAYFIFAALSSLSFYYRRYCIILKSAGTWKQPSDLPILGRSGIAYCTPFDF
jgi:hypothetical protein